MSDVFDSVIRPIGSSLGVIIPKNVVESEHLREGKKVQVSILTRDFSRLEALAGTVDEVEPFVRDRRDRV